MDNYLEYLIEKFLIFDKRAELDESNSIDDINKIKNIININFKKLTDDIYIKLTLDILEHFNCYDILDFSFKNKKDASYANDIYMLYKNYKMSNTNVTSGNVNQVNNNSLLEIDNDLDTSNVKYIQTIDYCIKFGKDALKIKSDIKKWNLEYKIKIKYGKSYYTFSVYNWIDDDRWHVASDTSNKKVINLFLKELEKYKIESCC